MSCDISANIGKIIKIETESLFIEDQSVDENHIICDTLRFEGLLPANCYGEIEEAILVSKHASAVLGNEISVYLFNEDPGTLAANDEIDLSILYQYLLGIIDFTSPITINNTSGEIKRYRGTVRDTTKGNLILNTALTSGVIYAVVFNENASSINFNGNTMQLTLKIWRY